MGIGVLGKGRAREALGLTKKLEIGLDGVDACIPVNERPNGRRLLRCELGEVALAFGPFERDLLGHRSTKSK